MLGIIDYGVGNLASIKNMLRKAGHQDVQISSEAEELQKATKLILPGVGHFDYGMQQLKQSGLIDVLNQRVLEDKVPILGICLGAQLLTASSEEGEERGLGWIDAKTVRFDSSKLSSALRVPHMGWADVNPRKESKLFSGMHDEPRFYFVHSYHMVCAQDDDSLVEATHGYTFTAGVERDNVLGVQFHPEKSHKFGLKLLSNFMEAY